MSDKILVIIPTLDECQNVEPMSQALLSLDIGADILFVDDNSPDGTGAVLDGIAAREPRVHVLHRTEKAGFGRACIAGIKWALERGYGYICEMDCDFSHDPNSLPLLLKAVREEADMVQGSRYIGGIRVMNWPMSRLLLSTAAGFYVRTITGLPLRDPTGGFRCFRRSVLESINLDRITSNGYCFLVEMAHTSWLKGFTLKEVPIVFGDRRAGRSKMRANIAFESMIMVLKLWVRAGFRRSPKKKAGSGQRPH